MGAAAVIAGVGLAVSTATTAYGLSQQADAAGKSAAYQAQVAKNNAAGSVQNAAVSQKQALAQASDLASLGSARIGSQRAALGASGVALDSGSALDVQQGTALATQKQVQQSLYEGTLKSLGYQVQASNQTAQAGLDILQGQNAQRAATVSALSSIASNATQVASKWYDYTHPRTAAV